MDSKTVALVALTSLLTALTVTTVQAHAQAPAPPPPKVSCGTLTSSGVQSFIQGGLENGQTHIQMASSNSGIVVCRW